MGVATEMAFSPSVNDASCGDGIVSSYAGVTAMGSPDAQGGANGCCVVLQEDELCLPALGGVQTFRDALAFVDQDELQSAIRA